jgi:hypothetical protein
MAGSKTRKLSLQLQNRDFALLCGLFESRIMTTGHIATLFFEGKREYTKKRLQKIKAAGLVGERQRRVNEPSILFLTRKGFTILKSQGMLSHYPALGTTTFEARVAVSELTLRHELDILDVKAAFHAALANSDKFSVAEFCTWPVLYQFEVFKHRYGAGTLVKPDGFIRIHEKEAGSNAFSYDCFLEVDRSSKDQARLTNQALCYLEYYRSGGFAVRNGAERTELKEFPFRVLMVLKSGERRNNLAEALLQNTPPILTQVWLTTLADVTAGPTGAIWIQPRDYREATNGTLFDVSHSRNSPIYRRQVEREMFVEKHVRKIELLNG